MVVDSKAFVYWCLLLLLWFLKVILSSISCAGYASVATYLVDEITITNDFYTGITHLFRVFVLMSPREQSFIVHGNDESGRERKRETLQPHLKKD